MGDGELEKMGRSDAGRQGRWEIKRNIN